MRKIDAKICAHRGLSRACPENTLPAFGAAIGLGVDEVEFDLWLTRDGVAAVCHDPRVDRTTDGEGVVTEMTWEAVQALDAGVKRGDIWTGVRVPRLEEVLDLVPGTVGLNIHIKDPGPDDALVKMVCDAIRERELLDVAYIAGVENVLRAARSYAPGVTRCCLAGQLEPLRQVELAVAYGCRRLQFGRKVTDEAIAAAKEAGLVRNLFWSDDPEDAGEYVGRGIEVVLTNEANKIISNLKSQNAK